MSDTSTSPRGREQGSGHFVDELRATFADRASRPATRARRSRDHLWRARVPGAPIRRADAPAGPRVGRPRGDPDDREAGRSWRPTWERCMPPAVSLPLNPRSTPDELRYYLQDSGARVVVAGQDEWPFVESLKPVLPELRALIPDREAWDSPEATLPDVSVDRCDPCLMLYSSGTTGRPKGVVHTHANLAASLRALAACWRFTPDDVLVNVLPLFHIHGLSFATHLNLLVGGTMHRRGAIPSAADARRHRPRQRVHGDPDVLLHIPRAPRVPPRRRRGGRASGCSPAARRRSGPRCCPSWNRSWAGR